MRQMRVRVTSASASTIASAVMPSRDVVLFKAPRARLTFYIREIKFTGPKKGGKSEIKGGHRDGIVGSIKKVDVSEKK